MAGRLRWRALSPRLLDLARRALVVGVFALAVTAVLAYALVEQTAQPAFCATCHIMQPYYDSWASSSHGDVPCIECHYEPGAVETMEGKFKALSQLAKYVTRTEGTKPWAEVSDQSCMRSGCHSVRMLEGPIPFGRVRFDHRHHLLESRRGRRLRCVTCHSQIVQGEHVTVTEAVCFTCHFMPGPGGEIPARTGDCLVCHGPPREPVEVAGRAFDHRAFVARGVRCQECHDPVVEGRGGVRQERCHSCHGEVGHIERIGETEFLHEKHVTEHKVECFECHDEIRHGLLPLRQPEPAAGEGCGACHVNPHEANRLLYAGTGAAGAADRPSRMYVTRVVCEACHTGRSGGASAHEGRAAVAPAGEVDCLHCHGTGYAGMLARWQEAVAGQLHRLRPLADDLRPALAGAGGQARRLWQEAWRDLELVERDGSRGAHNVSYALDVLAAAAARLDEAGALLGFPPQPPAASGFPLRSRDGCTDSCHLGVERVESVPLAGGRVFPHGRHLLAAKRECSACHVAAAEGQPGHGEPAFPRSECAACHHDPASGRGASDCESCHAAQAAMLAGTVPGFPETPGAMASMDCGECHGEAPGILRPTADSCVVCHGEGYDQKLRDWQAAAGELIRRAQAALATAPARGVAAAEEEAARAALSAVAADGSRGAHNAELTELLLRAALGRLGAE